MLLVVARVLCGVVEYCRRDACGGSSAVWCGGVLEHLASCRAPSPFACTQIKI